MASPAKVPPAAATARMNFRSVQRRHTLPLVLVALFALGFAQEIYAQSYAECLAEVEADEAALSSCQKYGCSLLVTSNGGVGVNQGTILNLLVDYPPPVGEYGVYYCQFYGPYPSPNNNGSQNFGPPSSTNPVGDTGEPINTLTGNFYSVQTDLAISGRGFPFVFNRYYNSLDTTAGPLGIGWTHSYNLSLTVNGSTGVVSVRQQDGSVVAFQPTSGGAYSPTTPGLFDALTMSSNGSYLLRRRNQTVLLFSSAGVLQSVTDRNGNTQTLAYTIAGDLASITDTVGRAITFAVNGSHQIVSMSDPVGRTVSYAYDPFGRLSTVTDPTGRTTTFTYNSSNQLLTGADQRGVVYVNNTYDSLGRVIAQTNGRGITWTLAYNSPTTGTTTITDGNGNTIAHVYNSSSQLAQSINGAGNTTSFSYNANNEITSVTDPKGNVASHTYDTFGNVLTTTNALGQTTTCTYDAMNDVTSVTDPAGVSTTLGYNSTGNLISVTNGLGNTSQLTRDAFGELLTVANPLGDQTQFTWDGNGDLIKAIDGSGRQWSIAYDTLGRPVALTDGLGGTSKAQYDLLNRTVLKIDALGNSTSFAYDAIGNLVKLTDANGNATQYAYDANANLIIMTDALGHQTTYAYDNNNNLIQVVNANGRTTTYLYDAANRLLSTTDPLGRSRKVTYDTNGGIAMFTDGNAETTTYSYDGLERVIGVTYGDGSVVGYTYDANGDLTQVSDPHGTSTFAYDVVHHLTGEQRSPSALDASGVAFRYDAAGRQIATVTARGATISKTFDGAGRLTSVTDLNGNSAKYAYDVAGRDQSILFPNGVSTAFKRDADGRLLNIRTSKDKSVIASYAYTLDKLGNRLAVVTPLGSTSFSYDALSRIQSVAVAGSGPLPYTYDPDGNILSIGVGPLVISYTYDAADELTNAGPTSFDYNGNGSILSRKAFGIETLMDWDSAGRLSAVSGLGGSTSYTYDGLGLRLTRSTVLGNRQYLYDRSTSLPQLFAQSTTWPVAPKSTQALVQSDIFLVGTDIESAVHLNRSGAVTNIDYLHQDGLGSTVAVTDPKGFVEASYVYSPWGLTLPTRLDDTREVLGQVPFGFAGQVTDQFDGLIYMRARYYDPTVGRFIGRDPRMPAFMNAWDRNPYVYARNNPERFRDPSGLAAASSPQPDSTGDPEEIEPPPVSLPGEPPLSCVEAAGAAAAEVCGELALIPPFGGPALVCTAGVAAVTYTACQDFTNSMITPGLVPGTTNFPTYPPSQMPGWTLPTPNPCATQACFQPAQ
jgi:RHS repeat-associated protein